MSNEEDFVFICKELARFGRYQRDQLAELLAAEPLNALATVPHPNGGGVHCGMDAYRRFSTITNRFLESNPCKAELVDDEEFRQSLLIHFGRAIWAGRGGPADTTPDEILNNAFAELEADFGKHDHYIAVRLAKADVPKKFNMGPVAFYPLTEFLDDRPISNEADEHLDGFGWIVGCESVYGSQVATRKKARRMIYAALDMMQLLLPPEAATHLVRTDAGEHVSRLTVLQSTTPGGNVSVHKNRKYASSSAPHSWRETLLRDGVYWLEAAGRAVACSSDKHCNNRLGQRVLDAACWYSEALANPVPGAKIANVANALERILRPSVASGKDELVKHARVLAGEHTPIQKSGIEDEVAVLYDLRSQLVHGGLSPRDPELARRADDALAAARWILLAGLNVFDLVGLDCTNVGRRRRREVFSYLECRAEEQAT